MKKFSKLLSIILIISLVASLLAQNVCYADSVSDITNATKVKKSQDDYLEYLKLGNDYTGAPISVDASGFIAAENSAPALSEYNGKSNVAIISESTGTLSWNVESSCDALFQVAFEYCPITDNENTIEMSFGVNNTLPYSLADGIVLPRIWVDGGKKFVDDIGNESSPNQIQTEKWATEYLKDVDGLYIEPLKFLLHAGSNTISLKLYSGSIALSKIILSGYEKPEKYSSTNVKNVYKGKDIVIQAEDASFKSSKELRPLSDNTDPSTYPSNAYHTCINSIGGNNWDSSHEKITWEIDVPESAFYSLTFRYKQGYLSNASSIRALTVDGKTPFIECEEIAFPYANNWELLTFGNDSPFYIYLEKGKREISLEVSLGPVSEISRKLEKLIYNVGEMYRQIIMITGTSPDANRDYRLYEQIPTLTDDLSAYIEDINSLVDVYEDITGYEGGSNAVNLTNLALVMERMLKSKFKAHKYVGDLFNNYCSASAWVYDMRNMPLDLDCLILAGKSINVDNYKSSFFGRFRFEIEKLIASYTIDYNSLSKSDSENSIDVWVNIGRDQSKVLQRMIEDTFTPKSGISVNVKISAASMIQANLSGIAPDATIHLAASTPVNLAMRGSLYDLSKFDDFNDTIIKNYGTDKAITPYKYKGGVYALADTISFPLMYVRNDIFEQLNIQVPKTWNEFLRASAIIMRNNLAVGVPEMYTTFLYQYGGTLYTEDLKETNLKSIEAFAAFKFFTDLYVEYKLPVSFSFYNRFRTGEMPLGIDSYTTYSTLNAAASEISGCWSVYPVPGVESESGINNTVIGSDTSSVILKSSDNPKAAWEFLKWWTGAEAQYRYSSDIESIVGVAARNPTANYEALQKLSWSRNDADVIFNQYKNTTFLPQVPGSYYITRSLDNAFYSVYNDGESPKEMLTKWALMVDEEMERKSKEYSDFN